MLLGCLDSFSRRNPKRTTRLRLYTPPLCSHRMFSSYPSCTSAFSNDHICQPGERNVGIQHEVR